MRIFRPKGMLSQRQLDLRLRGQCLFQVLNFDVSSQALAFSFLLPLTSKYCDSLFFSFGVVLVINLKTYKFIDHL